MSNNRQREARAHGVIDEQIEYNAEMAQRTEAETDRKERERQEAYLKETGK